MVIRSTKRCRAFTMLEVFAVLLLISTLIMMLLPAVQSSREMARRTSCANNLMQITMGLQAYHAAFDQFPVQLSGTDGSTTAGQDNDRRLSLFVDLLPFLGQPALYDQIHRRTDRTSPYGAGFEMGMEMMDEEGFGSISASDDVSPNREQWVAGGPEPFESTYIPWVTEPPVLRCPSDPGIGNPALARTNYAACLGDGVVAADSGPMKSIGGLFVVDPELARQTEAAMRGVFVPRVPTRFSDIADGLSQTIMLGEIATGLGDGDVRTHPADGPGAKTLRDHPNWADQSGLIDGERPMFWADPSGGSKLSGGRGMRRGYRWADGMPLYTGCNTILPPNREIILRDDRDDCWGILPPSSRHQGGAHAGFADAAVRFITDNIDAGSTDQPTVYVGSPNPPGSESPYGVWGALGTRASGELNSQDLGI